MLDWRDGGLQGPALDKHSTGGVGGQGESAAAPGRRSLAVVHARDTDSAARAADDLHRAYVLGDSPAQAGQPVIERLG